MRLRYAMVCSSNQNRSMEAHLLLKRQNMAVSSYGTGTHVKLPGPSIREPNVYEFGTPYKHMFEELRRKDPDLYPSTTGFKYCCWRCAVKRKGLNKIPGTSETEFCLCLRGICPSKLHRKDGKTMHLMATST